MNQANKCTAAHRPQTAHPAQRPQGARTAQRPSASPQTRRNPSARPPHGRPPQKRSKLPYGLTGLILLGVVAVALSICLQILWPNGFPLTSAVDAGAASEPAKIAEIHSNGPLRINEVMASNSSTLSLPDGSTPDWIEIANVSQKSVNLEGYSLSKSTNATSVFVFPDMTLNAGECVLVYADSRLRSDASDDLHAPFRIGAAGDTLMLFNAADTAVDTVNIPALGRDQSYARVADDAWEITSKPTPWLENSDESYQRLHQKVENSPVVISEIMASNASVKAGAKNLICDYIELYNRSSEPVSLTGWYLSDDQGNVRKWAFPELTLGAGEYLLVYASGQNDREDITALHTSFSLSSEGECAVLANSYGQVMDAVTYDVLKKNQALSLDASGNWTTALSPTPGRANQ